MNKKLIPLNELNKYPSALTAALALTALLLSTPAVLAQTTLAKWTFETLPSTLSYVPGAGVSTTNFAADIGVGNASGWHSGFGTPTYSSPAGNGSARSLSSNGWTNNPGDYYQFVVSTVGYQNIGVSFDQTGSGTGPGRFYLAWSTDGVTFTQFGSIYNVTNAPIWSAGTPTALTSFSFDLSTVTAINNAATVYIRLVDASTTSASGGTVGTSGTDRIDNVAITGSVPGTANITADLPTTTNVYTGDTLTLSVTANGTPTLYYQWYYPNLSTPLSDGPSGYGVGTISGSTSDTLTLTYVDPAQAGNYRLIVTNSLGSATSHVAAVTVTTRTPIVTTIAYLHTLLDANYALTDTTNLYQATGTVTTSADLVTGTSVYSFHIQDGTDGIDVFHRGGFAVDMPAAGDSVRVTAPLLQFNGLLEFAPVSGNPTHKLEDLSSGNPLPAPLPFDFTTIDPAYMESTIEGRYVVVSNVFVGFTNSPAVVLSGTSVFMTNLSGQVFRLFNPAAAIDPQGVGLPAFCKSVRGVITQGDATPPFDSNYSMFLLLQSDFEAGTAPVMPSPEPLIIQLAGPNAVLTWTQPTFNLQAAPAASGTYTNIPGATSPYTTPVAGQPSYFRLHYP